MPGYEYQAQDLFKLCGKIFDNTTPAKPDGSKHQRKVVTWRGLVVDYRRFGTTYWPWTL
jgi:hypothetical protein